MAILTNGSTSYIATNASGGSGTRGTLGMLSTEDFTVSAWFKTTQAGDNFAYGYAILGWDGDTYANFSVRGGKLLYIHYDSAWQYNIVSTTTVNDGAWHHGVYVNHGSTQTGDLYVDGAAEITGESSTISGGKYYQPYHCGRQYNGVYHVITAADLRMWSTALTASQVAELYYQRGTDRVAIASLMFRLPLIGSDGATASGAMADWSGTNNTGSVANSPVYAAAPLKV
jgi:hypothetical protein